jgi:hypothetical protein
MKKIQDSGSQNLDTTSGVPRNFFRWVQQIQLRTGQRERGSGGGSPLVRGFVIWYKKFFLICKLFLIFGTLDYL